MKLDPLKSLFKAYRAWIMGYQHKYDEAVQILHDLIHVDPHYTLAHYFLGYFYSYIKKYKKANEHAQKAIAYGGRSVINLGILGIVLASEGKKKETEAVLAELIDIVKQSRGYPIWIARVYAAAGESEKMFEWLEKAYQDRDVQLYHISVQPVFDAYRDDERFATLIKKMGFNQ